MSLHFNSISIPFVKMHGLGNDFILLQSSELPAQLIKSSLKLHEVVTSLSNRYTGLGFDQLILYDSVKTAVTNSTNSTENQLDYSKYEMRIFNPDGSEAQVCGNGTRCLVKLIFQTTGQTKVWVRSGPKDLLCQFLPAYSTVSVNVGAVSFTKDWIPKDYTKIYDLLNGLLKNIEFKIVCVDVGNPHLIILNNINQAPPFSAILMELIGKKLQDLQFFPYGINVSFAQVINDGKILLSVWERGVCEITNACGSGACGTFAAAVKNGYVHSPCEIIFKYGNLKLSISGDGLEHIIMEGPAKLVAKGTYFYDHC